MFRNWVFQNFPFLENDFDALTDYELFCKMMEYVKNFAKDNEEFKIKLETYDNYFKNLDVQEEIDNKLDEMAEDGTLTDIIAQYLTLQGVLAFNTINDLKNALNIVNGSITRTIGSEVYNDGKGSYYKIRTITSGDIVDEVNILSIVNYNTLVAEKITDYSIVMLLNKSQYGFTGNNTLTYTDIDTFKNDVITDSYLQGNYLVYATIGGVIECLLISKVSNSYLTFINFSYNNVISQYRYQNGNWYSEEYADNIQIESLQNKIQYGFTGNNTLTYTDIDTFKNDVITDTYPQGNYLVYASINGVIETIILSKANNTYLSFIMFSYNHVMIQYRYQAGVWTTNSIS